MSYESDGVGEEFAARLRVALTVAGQLAEQIARSREQAARQAEAQSTQAARELQQRLAAEGGAVRAQLTPVYREEWWHTARPEEIAEVWQTAQTWRELDPDAGRAAERIEHEMRERYGIDPSTVQADPAGVRDQIAEATPGKLERQGEEAEAARLMAAAAAADLDAAAAPSDTASPVAYDTPERREQLAASLEHIGDRDAVQARLLADQARGRPPEDAVRNPPADSTRAADPHATAAPRVATPTVPGDSEAGAARELADQARGAPPSEAVRTPPQATKARNTTAARPSRQPRRRLDR